MNNSESTSTSLSLAQLPCTQLKRVGAKIAQCLAKKGIETIQDLLLYLPYRYQDRTHITPICDLRTNEYAVVEGIVNNSKTTWGRRPSMICDIVDQTGQLQIRFFHFYAAQKQHFVRGTKIRLFGEVHEFKGHFSIIHPEYQVIHAGEDVPVAEHLTPIYTTTEGLSQHSIRQLIDQAMNYLQEGHTLTEILPESLRQQFQLVDITQAVRFVHNPPPDAAVDLLLNGVHPMQRRLAFEELLAQQLSLRRLRQKAHEQKAPVLNADGDLLSQFFQQLPFTLTNAQRRVVDEIFADITQSTPMIRLMQGDVGSGKTVVALLASLRAVASGYQAVLMVPTEILAEQHYRNFLGLLKDLDVYTVCLTGKLSTRDRNYILAAIGGGQAQIIIGTHALFQKEVSFSNLALVIIDEQHRFGVHQRMALRDKTWQTDVVPHQLVMTATPIPRTLAMTAYADMDYSVIDELPPGRTPIKSVAIPNSRRDEVLERVKEVCQKKQQTYWVCTLIDESEVLQCQAAEKTAQALQESLPGLTIGLVHGRLASTEKETIMQQFKEGAIDLLVATTVIEVGVDVPNASLMIIENPERLGLAQLHQLRGRVGRGTAASHCVLLYQSPLSDHAKSRLAIMRETNDGFAIAQRDLELRGPGEVLGTRQAGMMRFKIADIIRDKDLLGDVRRAAKRIEQDYSHVIPLLIQRWLGDNEQYGKV